MKLILAVGISYASVGVQKIAWLDVSVENKIGVQVGECLKKLQSGESEDDNRIQKVLSMEMEYQSLKAGISWWVRPRKLPPVKPAHLL